MNFKKKVLVTSASVAVLIGGGYFALDDSASNLSPEFIVQANEVEQQDRWQDDEMVDWVNNHRAEVSKEEQAQSDGEDGYERVPLEYNDQLNGFAEWKAQDMAEKGYFAHNDPNGPTWSEQLTNYLNENGNPGFNIRAENLANSTADLTPEEFEAVAFKQWLNSTQGHRENMENEKLTHLGYGAYYDENGTHGGIKWYGVQVFGGIEQERLDIIESHKEVDSENGDVTYQDPLEEHDKSYKADDISLENYYKDVEDKKNQVDENEDKEPVLEEDNGNQSTENEDKEPELEENKGNQSTENEDKEPELEEDNGNQSTENEDKEPELEEDKEDESTENEGNNPELEEDKGNQSTENEGNSLELEENKGDQSTENEDKEPELEEDKEDKSTENEGNNPELEEDKGNQSTENEGNESELEEGKEDQSTENEGKDPESEEDNNKQPENNENEKSEKGKNEQPEQKVVQSEPSNLSNNDESVEGADEVNVGNAEESAEESDESVSQDAEESQLPETGEAKTTEGLIAGFGLLLTGMVAFLFGNRRKEKDNL